VGRIARTRRCFTNWRDIWLHAHRTWALPVSVLRKQISQTQRMLAQQTIEVDFQTFLAKSGLDNRRVAAGGETLTTK